MLALITEPELMQQLPCHFQSLRLLRVAEFKAKRDIAEANTTAEINAILSAIAWGA